TLGNGRAVVVSCANDATPTNMATDILNKNFFIIDLSICRETTEIVTSKIISSLNAKKAPKFEAFL
ncbi:MAG TPA: hypothetical protein DEG63_07905, partial [Flavobacteriaceae bacterium]|nr:hypothetical protein [Flavobacteriaceae bacterium]